MSVMRRLRALVIDPTFATIHRLWRISDSKEHESKIPVIFGGEILPNRLQAKVERAPSP
jgi:hypothetical protein